jgi:hypothetical protein
MIAAATTSMRNIRFAIGSFQDQQLLVLCRQRLVPGMPPGGRLPQSGTQLFCVTNALHDAKMRCAKCKRYRLADLVR